MCMGGGGGGNAAAQAREDEKRRQERIQKGMGNINETFSTFDDSFYDRRANAYKAFAMPNVESQYKDAHQGLVYNLARSGNLASSEAARQMGILNQDRNSANLKVADASLDYANKSRQQVEQARTDLVNQLMATADPSTAASQAAARSATLTPDPAMVGLGDLFGNTMKLANVTNKASMYLDNAPGWSAWGIGSKPTGGGGSVRYVK